MYLGLLLTSTVTIAPWAQAAEYFVDQSHPNANDSNLGTQASPWKTIAKANSTDPEKLIAATEGLSMPSPFGEITFRKIDHQSTLGAYVGKTALKDGKGVMVDSVYRKGSDYLPSDVEVGKLRPKE
jgi:hypothetical protein